MAKQKFGLCSTTYYSTVPITCTQTRIHRTQYREDCTDISMIYGKLENPESGIPLEFRQNF